MLLRLFRLQSVRKGSRRCPRSFRPILMGLEDRLVPSQVDWIAGNGDFGTAANWRDNLDGSHHVPGPGDYATIGNSNATVTVGASYSVDHLFTNCRLVLNSGALLSLANPVNGSTISSLLLNSGATLQTTGGTTVITGDSAFAGTFNTAAGASLGFTGGTQMVNAGTALNGPGAYYVSGGFFNITGTIQLAPANFTLSGNGTLGGTGTFEVPSGATFTWNAGTQAGPGTTQIDAGGTMTLVSGNKKPLDGRIVSNSGTALMGPDDTYGMDTGNNAIWTNKSGAVFNIQTNVNIFHFFGNSPGLTINNAGTFRKAVGTTTLVGGVVLNNTGTLDLQSGTLELAGGGSNSSTITLASSAALAISNNNATYTFAPGTAVNGTGLVHITDGHLNVTGNVSVANTALDSGSLDGTGTYTIATAMNVVYGGMGGTGTTVVSSGATFTIIGQANQTPYLSGRTLENDGTVNWNNSWFFMYNAATINNNGTWNVLTSGLRMYNNGGLPSTFNNSGTVSKPSSSGNGNSSIEIAFNNNGGTVAVHNGALNFAGGTITDGSTYTVDANASVDLLAYNATVTVSGTISGTGAGLVVISGDGNGNGTIIPVGATLNFDPGVLQWTGASLYSTTGGTLTNTGDLTLTGAHDKYIDGTTLTNTGTIEWTGTGFWRAYNAATINNAGTFTAQTAQAGLSLFNQSGLPSTFNNTGTLVKAGDNNTANISIAFNNSAAVVAQNGALNFSGGTITDGSTYTVGAGTSVDLLAANANVTVSGTISGTGAGLVVISGDGSGNGTVIVPAAGATFNFDPGVLQWTGAGIFTSDGGTLTNAGAMTITGTNDKYLNTNTPQNNHIFTLDNEGTILWAGTGRIRTANGAIINNGTSFDIQTGDQGDGLRMDNYSGLLSTFINAGSLTKSAGLAYAHIGIDLENQGSVALSSGGLDLYGGGHSTGNMDVAAGTILAFTANGGVYYLDAGASITDGGTTEVINNSTLDVRAAVTATEFVLGDNHGSYGTLQIDDTGMLTLVDPNTGTPYNFTMYNGGLVIEFSGSTAGAGYGQLNVGAAAQLGGNLYLTMLNGYRPAAGTAFQILTFASHTQSFSNINGTNLGGGLVLNPTYDPTDFTLTAAQTGPNSGGDDLSVVPSQAGVMTSAGPVDAIAGLDQSIPMMHAGNGGRAVGGAVGQSMAPVFSSIPMGDAFFQAIADGTGNDGWINLLG